MEYVKHLTTSEAKYKYLDLTKEAREEYPKTGELFDLKFKNKTYKVWVNNKDCFMISQLYKQYQFQEGDEIKVVKKNENTFELSLT